jgi:membrane protein
VNGDAARGGGGGGGWHRSVLGVVRRTLEAAFDDNIPFLASALSFDILLTAIPFVGLALATVGYLVQHQITTHQVDVHELLQRFLPAAIGTGDADAFGRVERALESVVAQRGRLTAFGVPLFLWFSTRLFGGLRAALNEVFDTDERRPWPVAKLLDLAMVLATGALLVANALLSAIGGGKDAFLWRFGSELGALAFGTGLFFLIFKTLPSRRIHWRTGLVASLFCAVAFEIAKRLYALYVTRFATLDRLASDANVVGFLLFLLWIYFTAYVFLLGGEVAETYDLMRMRRQQRVPLG